MNFSHSIIELIISAIALGMLIKNVLKFFRRENEQTIFKFILSIIVWASIFFFAFFPQLARIISSLLGFGENLNTLIFVGFVLAFLAIFKLINVVERIERNISEIVRKEALSKLEKE